MSERFSERDELRMRIDGLESEASLAAAEVAGLRRDKDALKHFADYLSERLCVLWHNDEIGQDDSGLDDWMGLSPVVYSAWARGGVVEAAAQFEAESYDRLQEALSLPVPQKGSE
jgi:hypothetical protein